MINRRSRRLLALSTPVLGLLFGGCPADSQLGGKAAPAKVNFEVEAITPPRGPVAGGTRVTIRGGPFRDNIGVLFGDHAAIDPIIVNESMITAVTPPQAAKTVDVMIMANGGQLTVLGAYKYEVASNVALARVFPASGLVTGGAEVTITGHNFTPGTAVLFGSTASSQVSVLSDQLIVATTPAGEAGMVDVTLQSSGSQDVLHGAFEYQEIEPVFTSVEPSSGPQAGGTLVTVRGTNIPKDIQVFFGTTPAATFEVLGDAMLTAVSPPHEGAAASNVIIRYKEEDFVAGPFSYVGDAGPIDDGTDSDGDGLTDFQETAGWEVWTDQFGLQLGIDTFGNVTRWAVTSDPLDEDSDDDGLNDRVEFLIKSDPRKFDTDDDGLWDGEEWNQWLTSPTGVDTDADARGDRAIQNMPNQALFDGMELFDPALLRLPPNHELRVVRARATSPTLMDTDGDGVDDFNEYDSTVRNGVIADLPRLEYELVGDVDVRLNVQYAESEGQEKVYATTLSESQSETVGSSFSNTLGWSVDVMVGYQASAGIFSWGTFSTEVTAGVHGEYTWTSSNESTRAASEEYTRQQSDSKEFTETAASGEVRTAILLSNKGNNTFTLRDLSTLIMQRQKLKEEGDVSEETPIRTIATMHPSFAALTLAPGETAGPFELAATNINAQNVKELLAHPDTLLLGTAAVNFTDEDGLDLDFVRQFTIAQTATITIDFGDGEVRTYNVATNVDRNPDSTYRGITLRRVFEENLHLPYGDAANGYTTMVSPLNGRMTLDALLGRAYETPVGDIERGRWTIITSNPAHADVDFNDVVLRAGESLHLFYQQDDDQDGVSNTIEQAAGTTQSPLSGEDSDGDGLSDNIEIVSGWVAFENPNDPDAPNPHGFAKRRVFSDPRVVDTDGDGFDDLEEQIARTNPNDPDTDGDDIQDGADPFPLIPAGIRYVKADAAAGGDGKTWAAAYRSLQEALADAAAGQATPAEPDDDVAQIWVARGEYKPTNRTTPFQLLNQVAIYGGFSGPSDDFPGEQKRGQRLREAAINGCIISGDLAGNDVGPATPDDGPGVPTRADNAAGLVRADPTIDASAILDGFTLTGSASFPALFVQGSPTIQNCMFTRNGTTSGAGAVIRASGAPVFRDCVFAANVANLGGGAYVNDLARPRFERCSFEQNEAKRSAAQDTDTQIVNGGGLWMLCSDRVDLIECSFVGNQAWNWGAGIFADDSLGGSVGYLHVDSCRFFNNVITRGGAGGDWRGAGGAIFNRANAAVFNSVFWGNFSESHGGAIVTFRPLAVNNCTFADNRSLGTDHGGGITAGTRDGLSGTVSIENTILWNNWTGRGELPDDPDYYESDQIDRRDSAVIVVRNSCFNRPGAFAGNNNIGADPKLLDIELGDLRIGPNSPCIDRGNGFVDMEPLVAGLQKLPDFDFFGGIRITDGNSDGFAAVDIGACEATPSAPPQ